MLIKSGQDWTFELLNEILTELDDINKEKYQLDIYPSQVEVISYEQMLDAYSNMGGVPVLYPHWSFGENFVKYIENYKRGRVGLALEIIIGSNPALCYIMEENSLVAQATVLAHASYGHSFCYKNNYFIKQWQNHDSIIDYLVFAKKYITECERKYGIKEVEKILDACHALQYHGIDKYKRPSKISKSEEEKRKTERDQYLQSQINDLWNAVTEKKNKKVNDLELKKQMAEFNIVKEPQENLLYFLEKNAPLLKEWQREILRIVRKIAQYFYPQMMTSVIHEATAVWVHYHMIEDLYNRGKISDDGMLEFYKLHSAVIAQPDYFEYNNRGMAPRINHYALGFAIFRDIERISMDPTEEDREWFKGQDWVGNGDYIKNIKWVVQNFKDDSLILQFLSPKVIRDFKMFAVRDDDAVSEEYMVVDAIHDERGYKKIRLALSKRYNIATMVPNIQVVDVDILGDRTLYLEHVVIDRRPLHNKSVEDTLAHLSYLWKYPVLLQSVDKKNNIIAEWECTPDPEQELDFDLSDL